MKSLPKIILKTDINEETQMFYSFLHHKYFVGHRGKILRMFPELEKQLINSTDEKKDIKDFLRKYYNDNKNKIDGIVTKNKTLISKKSKLALSALGELMDYEWGSQTTYYTIPTVSPFSPFKDDTFFLSILSQIKGYKDETKNALSVSIHEISHFVFYKQLEKLKQSESISKEISKDLIHYYKESLAAVLLNRKPLQSILGIRNYRGNPELWELNIKIGDQKININYFLNDLYEKIKIGENKPFHKFLEESIKVLQLHSQEFHKKWDLWSKIGMAKDKEKQKLLKRYSNPIVIKK